MSVQQARRLRRKLTDAERKLWSRLRNCQVADLKFRRQHPLGDRIVDFFCSEAKLAISWTALATRAIAGKLPISIGRSNFMNKAFEACVFTTTTSLTISMAF